MSKMPAKKKSCFQITSVTQAQVAASSGADDTESLDDPDESRTEDVSSEIFDVSRRPSGGGGGADLLGACDRSSSEEMLNNVGEQHQEGGHPHHHQGPVNGGFSVRGSAGCSGPVTPHLAGGGVPAGPTASQAPSAPSSTTTTQPMVNSVLHHHHHVTVPANVAPVIPVAATSTTTTSSSSTTTTTTTMFNSRFRVIKLDHGSGEPFRRGRWTCTEFYERDSEGSSMSMSRTVDSMKHAVVLDHNNVDRGGDSGLGGGVTTGGSSVVIPGAGGGSAQESNNNNNADSGYSVAYHTHPPEQPPPPQQGYTLASQAGSAGASAFQPSTGGYSTALPQQHPQQANNMQPGVPQNLLHPSGLNGGAPLHGATTTLHKFPLMPPAAQQFAYSTHGGGGGQLDYRQQQFAALQPHGSNAQNLLSVGPPGAGQGGSSWPSAISPAGVGGLGMVAQGGGGEAASAVAQQGLMFQLGGGGGGASSVGSVLLATTTTTIAFNSVHNVPATVPNNSMLNHTPGAGGGGGGFESGRKSDILPQPGALAAKDGGVPFISQRVGGGAPTTVSIFGIPITIDGDEDSTSGASVVAIDNKIEQAMDLVKSHLMYAVREEVEVLKEQIKELFERNSMLERENAVLKSLANTEQLSLVVAAASQAVSVSATSPSSGSMSPPQQQHEQMIVQHHPSTASLGAATATNNNNSPNASLAPHEGGQQTAPAHHQHGSA